MKISAVKNNFYPALMTGVFCVAVLLRVGLTAVNRWANDDHLRVAAMIERENRLPVAGNCWECFQPKLYHALTASVLEGFSVQADVARILVAQSLSCLAGILTLCVVWLFLCRVTASEKARVICFSLVALNPELLGMNAQATNDSFVILFSTLAMYFLFVFLSGRKAKDFVWLTVSAVFAGLTKGNGLVLLPGIVLVFVFKILAARNFSFNFKKGLFGYLLVFVLTWAAFVPSLGQYWEYYRRFGSPFVINQGTDPFPHFWEKTFHKKPGVTSIASSYLTFRFFDLIKNPLTSFEKDIYPAHRTSLWSQLYGKAHFLYFVNWPEQWNEPGKRMLTIGRLSLVLALVPSCIFLAGVIARAGVWLRALLKRSFEFIRDSDLWIFDIFFFGYFCFIIALTLRHRDFMFMKFLYVLPGLLAGVHMFLEGARLAYAFCERRLKICRCIELMMGMLVLLYCSMVVSLILKLA